MRTVIQQPSIPSIRRTVVAVLATLVVACAPPQETPPAGFSDDERYLIDTYLAIRAAQNLYPRAPESAESLFVVYETGIDSSRVALTIENINRTPDRWPVILQEIEDLMRKSVRDLESKNTQP